MVNINDVLSLQFDPRAEYFIQPQVGSAGRLAGRRATRDVRPDVQPDIRPNARPVVRPDGRRRRPCRQRRRKKKHLIEAAPFGRLDQM